MINPKRIPAAEPAIIKLGLNQAGRPPHFPIRKIFPPYRQFQACLRA